MLSSIFRTHTNAKRLVLAITLLLGALSMPKNLNVGDPYTWREEARSILLHGQLNIEPKIAASFGEPGQNFVLNKRNGLYYSKYGIMNSLVTALPLGAELLFTKELPVFGSNDRNFYLGLFYIALSLLIVSLLYTIAQFYSANPLSCAAYVLTCLFCTFLWHHLRSGGQEAVQLLFFSGMFYGFLSYVRNQGSRTSLVVSYLCLAGLALTKFSFLYLVPLLTLACFAYENQRSKPLRLGLHSYSLIVLLATCASSVALFFSWLRFGSPFLTGYEQFNVHEVAFTGSYLSFLRGILFSEQWSFFSLFPVLLLALPFLWPFFKKHKLEAAFLFSSLVFFMALVGRLPIWRGEWSYGPRYFAFILPFVSLPALSFFDWIFAKGSALWPRKAAALGIASIILGLSLFLQFQVERGDPFLYYWTRPLKSCLKNEHVKDYFLKAHYGRINFHLFRSRSNVESLWFMPIYRVECGPERYEKFRKSLSDWLNQSNFYWFPGFNR